MTFLIAFSAVFIILLISSINTLRRKNNRTIQNVFTIIFMIMTLFGKNFPKLLYKNKLINKNIMISISLVRIGVLIMALKETLDDPFD